MEHCRQINFTADRSTHSTNDCLVTVAWASEISAGVFARVQVMKTGPVSPQDLSDDDNLLLQISKTENWKGLLHSDSLQRSATKSRSWAEACESRVAEQDDNDIRHCRE